jgi:hypothetical protein
MVHYKTGQNHNTQQAIDSLAKPKLLGVIQTNKKNYKFCSYTIHNQGTGIVQNISETSTVTYGVQRKYMQRTLILYTGVILTDIYQAVNLELKQML